MEEVLLREDSMTVKDFILYSILGMPRKIVPTDKERQAAEEKKKEEDWAWWTRPNDYY